MANNADWVEDVRRWYFAGRSEASPKPTETSQGPAVDELAALGYEAAHPALQARNWPDAPSA